MQKAFAEYDDDNSGSISREELFGVAANLGVELADDELDAAMKAMDLDGSGAVSMEEFKEWFMNRGSGEVDDTEQGSEALAAAK
eukprot:COSAG05_NODE_13371_length_433_cov_0.619760_1_plen_83_part_10